MAEIIGYKKLKKNKICKLKIIGKNNQKRKVVNSNYAQYRCSKVEVLQIYHMDTKESYEEGDSIYNNNFHYKVGEIIEIDYDETNKIFSRGIHYFLTEEAAYFYNLDKVYNGHYFQWCENGRLITECNYIEGKIEGELKYYVKEKLSSVINYKKGLRDGVTICYYNSGIKSKQCYYVNNRLDGLYQEWDPKGRLFEEINYVLDKKEGIERKYNQGKLMKEYNYKAGKLQGLQKGWWDNGNKYFKHNYHNNLKEGVCINYDINGNKASQQIYNRNLQEGIQLEFYENGKIQTEYRRSQGKKQGKLIHYDVDGNIDVEENYVDDMLEGLCIYHHLFSREELNYSMGMKQGTQRVYNDANIIIQEYSCIDDKKYGIETFYDHYGRKEKEIKHVCREGIMKDYIENVQFPLTEIKLEECYELSSGEVEDSFGDDNIKLMNDFLENEK